MLAKGLVRVQVQLCCLRAVSALVVLLIGHSLPLINGQAFLIYEAGGRLSCRLTNEHTTVVSGSNYMVG